MRKTRIVRTISTLAAAAMMLASAALMSGCKPGKPDFTKPVSFPLEKETTLSWWYPYDTTFMGDFTDMNDHPFMKRMKEKTNITFEFTYPTKGPFTGGGSEEFANAVAAGTVPDMVTHNWTYPATSDGTDDGVIEDGIYMDLTQLISIHMPNLMAMRQKSSTIDKIMVTNQGHILCIPKILSYSVDDKVSYTSGIAIRQDMLDEYQLDTPETISDWYNILTTLHVTGGVEYPVSVGYWGGPWTGSAFFTAYHVSNTQQFSEEEEGKIVYGPILEGTRDYLMEMNKWYNEGLIVYNEHSEEADYISDDVAAVLSANAGQIETLNSRGQNPKYNLVGVKFPTLERGEVINYLGNLSGSNITIGTVDNASVCISAECSHPDYALAWLDLFYTDDMYYESSYGIEGQDYTKNEDGTIAFTDKIKGTDDIRSAISQNAFLNSMYYDSQVFVKYAYSERVMKAIELWSVGTDKYTVPKDGLTLTADEEELKATAVGNYFGDLVGLRGFVTGERPFTEWDSFVQSMQSVGVEEENMIYQQAYERYLAG